MLIPDFIPALFLTFLNSYIIVADGGSYIFSVLSQS